MLPILMAAPGPFDNETDCAALLTPTVVFAKEMLVGDTDAVAGVTPPIPESVTIWGLFEAESLKERLAVRVPVPVGEKTTLTEQEAPTETVAPQVLLMMTKSDAFVPVTEMPLRVRGRVPPLDNATDWAELLVPTPVLA